VQAEALAAGARVIAADSEANREVLGGAACIVAPERGAFARVLRGLSPPDPASAEIAKAASRRFSASRQVDRMIELYKSLDEANVRSIS